MSMYDMVMGDGKAADRGAVLLGVLGFTSWDAVGRYRDSWVENHEGKPVIAVYTRNGGGNRECYADPGDCDGTCTGCTATVALPSHPLYLSDRDDDFDCTYATFYFRVPDDATAALLPYAIEPVDMSDVWLRRIAAING